MGEESHVLFKLLGLEVTGEVTTTWAIILILTVFSVIATRSLKERPGRLQNIAEMAVETLFGFFSGILGQEKSERYLSFFGTLFIFIAVSNYSGLLPGAGSLKGFSTPTASISVTAALSLIVFGATHYLGIRNNGLGGYARHFISPIALMLPFLIIEEIVRPLSLSLRLYGNIFGEESVTEQLYSLLPIGAPLIMMTLSLLFCAIQAAVFTMLSAIYISSSTSHEH